MNRQKILALSKLVNLGYSIVFLVLFAILLMDFAAGLSLALLIAALLCILYFRSDLSRIKQNNLNPVRDTIVNALYIVFGLAIFSIFRPLTVYIDGETITFIWAIKFFIGYGLGAALISAIGFGSAISRWNAI